MEDRVRLRFATTPDSPILHSRWHDTVFVERARAVMESSDAAVKELQAYITMPPSSYQLRTETATQPVGSPNLSASVGRFGFPDIGPAGQDNLMPVRPDVTLNSLPHANDELHVH